MSKHYKRAIIILADGARYDVMKELLDQGKLPEIGEHLAAGGSFQPSLTCFPSTTGPAYLPFLTGCYPGTCNVPGIRWFDKDCYAESSPWSFSKNRFRSYVGAETLYMNGDIAPGIKTLFELIPGSVSLFSSITRGVGFFGDKSRFSHIWYGYYGYLTDHWDLVDAAAIEKGLKILKSLPDFYFVVQVSVDKFSHYATPTHPKTLEAYGQIDRLVGAYVRQLKSQGVWDETAIFIVSDHGLSETGRHFPLNQFLENSGIRTLFYPKVVFKWGCDAASMVSGNGMAHLYFKDWQSQRKGRHAWKGRNPWESFLIRKDRITERLLEQEEVDLLAAVRHDGSVIVKSRRGQAVIQDGGGGQITYTVQGGDPFGYGPLPARMADREALEKTFDSDYPDAPAQLLQIFKSRRSGDLIISSSKGYDLRLRHEIPEHKSTHGGLHWEHMQVPLVTNVKLPAGPSRSVDVFPTILKALDRPIPDGIDGVSLL